MSRESAESLLGIDGKGNPYAWSPTSPAEVRRPNYGNWFRLGIFLLLALLPLRWVFVESGN
jgi:hypothetical protein